jgi:ribonuclease E
MTLEEQEVYAQMGISPLVFIGKEVKDPRNAVVSVVLPGEAPKTLPMTIPANGEDTAIEEVDLEIISDESDAQLDFPDLSEARVVEAVPDLQTESFPDLNESKLEPVEEPVHKSPEASRRRRRTSATT